MIMLITNGGTVMRMAIDGVSVIGRNTSGVRIMNIKKDSNIQLAGMARLLAEFIDDDDENIETEVTAEESEE